MNEIDPIFQDPNDQKNKARILFLAWGFSIHAKRRIEIFAEDPNFEIMVVSTFNYQLPKVQNVLLTKNNPQHTQINNANEKNNPDKKSISFFKKYIPEKIRNQIISIKEIIEELITSYRHLIMLRKNYFEFKPNLIFLQTLLYPSYLAFFLPKKTPIITTFWNGDILWWAQWNGVERWLKKQIVQYGVERSNFITVNSDAAYRVCLNYGKPENYVSIVRYPGIDLNLFREENKEKAKNMIGVSARHVVFWPRGIGSYLNFDILVDAVPYIINKISDIIFLVFPIIRPDQEFFDNLNKKGIISYMEFRENVSFEAMPLYYSASDVMVSISSNDSQPNTMLEAMACGCPVVMGDIPQIREWILQDVNGFIVELRNPITLAETIVKAINLSPDELKTMKLRNRILIESRIDSKKMKNEIKKVVNRTIKQE